MTSKMKHIYRHNCLSSNIVLVQWPNSRRGNVRSLDRLNWLKFELKDILPKKKYIFNKFELTQAVGEIPTICWQCDFV